MKLKRYKGTIAFIYSKQEFSYNFLIDRENGFSFNLGDIHQSIENHRKNIGITLGEQTIGQDRENSAVFDFLWINLVDFSDAKDRRFTHIRVHIDKTLANRVE